VEQQTIKNKIDIIEKGGIQMQYISTLIPFILMIGLFYLFIFVPENKRKKKYSNMQSSLKVNDEIMTRGGIIGKLINIQDKFVILETGPDRARIKLDKNGISHVLNSNAEENSDSK
jgi:preprotein translocase subunit YajC